MEKILFNIPPYINKELDYIKEAVENKKICGDGLFTKKCHSWFEQNFGVKKALLTTSCTDALEMSALLIDVKPGDEVIVPSYTFVSTALAFVMRGAKIIFVDVDPKTMNMDIELVKKAITPRTKAIVPVHYAGVACEMDELMEIANKNGIYVIEDAAQGVMSTYNGKYLGTIGHIGCYSFHETKNYSSGEGGLILINDESLIERAEILREKGTNRSNFIRGIVDKYTWHDLGSSYLMSDLNAAYLYAQLEMAEEINQNRLARWERYNELLTPLATDGHIEIPYIPNHTNHNAHMYYIKVKDLNERNSMIDYLKEKNVSSVFHYIPLHSSPAGMKFGEFFGDDNYTTLDSERLLRLPLYYNIEFEKIDYVCEQIKAFYNRGV